MKQKIKYLLIGVIIGVLISSNFVSAESLKQFVLNLANYPIVIDGQEYKNDELPVLNYQGNTYVPLKEVGNILGTNVKWNDELKRVEIGNNSITNDTNQEEVIETTFNGLRAIKIDGDIYFNAKDYTDALAETSINKYKPENTMEYNYETKTSIIYYKDSKTEILFNDINVKIYNGETYFNSKFYISLNDNE